MKGFEVWFEREYPRVLAACLAFARDPELAGDATAEAFSRALARWDHVSGLESPGGWTCTVGLNVARRALRRRGLERTLLGRSAPGLTEPAVPDLDVWRAVSTLPARMRTAVTLRYVADLSEREVGEAMGISRGAVAASLASARKRLAARLDPDPDPEELIHG